MYILIDNYDSFTYNLYQYLSSIGIDIKVVRNDKTSVDEILNNNYKGIIISPGPCTPLDAGICLDLIKKSNGSIPILGICLGHQSIGMAFGSNVVKGEKPVHGKISTIKTTQKNLFFGLPAEFNIVRYHSLVVENIDENVLSIDAVSSDGVIQAISHKSKPIFGVQFHPESIMSEYGIEIIKNFVNICENYE